MHLIYEKIKAFHFKVYKGRCFVLKGNIFKKIFAAILSVSLIMSVMTGCTSSVKGSSGNNTGSAMTDTSESYDNNTLSQTADNSNGEEESTDERKIIKTVDISLETLEFDKLISDIQALTDEYDGYIENSSVHGNSSYNDSKRDYKSASMTLRIPNDKVDEFCQKISEESNVLHRNDSTEDVTLNYIDTESKKKSLELQQERLLELLENAESLEEIITLEQRLSDVRYELESVQSQLNYMDNKVDYSTVNLDISETVKYTVTSKGFFERITEGWSKNITNIVNGTVNLTILFIINIPYFLIMAIPVIITLIVIKIQSSKKRKANSKVNNSSQNMNSDNNTPNKQG